jgi:hypothetical protein
MLVWQSALHTSVSPLSLPRLPGFTTKILRIPLFGHSARSSARVSSPEQSTLPNREGHPAAETVRAPVGRTRIDGSTGQLPKQPTPRRPPPAGTPQPPQAPPTESQPATPPAATPIPVILVPATPVAASGQKPANARSSHASGLRPHESAGRSLAHNRPSDHPRLSTPASSVAQHTAKQTASQATKPPHPPHPKARVEQPTASEPSQSPATPAAGRGRAGDHPHPSTPGPPSPQPTSQQSGSQPTTPPQPEAATDPPKHADEHGTDPSARPPRKR